LIELSLTKKAKLRINYYHYQYRAEEEGIKVAGHSFSQPYQAGLGQIDLMQHHQRQPTTKRTRNGI